MSRWNCLSCGAAELLRLEVLSDLPGAVWRRGWLDIVGCEEGRLLGEVGRRELLEEKSKLSQVQRLAKEKAS